ncbi:MAG: hypothetical protein EPN50_09485 [Chloroflexota bacterium]|nr:MAG: hypothetical protein EPN50_09485 [Chloroflexota bacterium]
MHGRWFATETSWACSTQTAMLYLAVSDTADPRSTWHIFQLSFNELPDYPALAVSSDKVVLSANLFPFSGSGAPGCFANSFDRGVFGAIDLAPLLATPSSPGTFTYSGQYFNGFSWRPAGDPTSSTVYAVAENVAGVGGGVLSGSVSGTQAAKNLTFSTPYDLTAAGKAAAFALPPAPEQQGSPATIAGAVDERPTDAVWAGGHLWFVATAPCTPSGDTQARDCVRLVELGTGTATPTVQQDFEIADSGFDDFMGAIGVSGVGALIVVFSQSSPTSFVTTYSRVQEPGAATATLGAPLRIEQGLGTYAGTRWGDYVLLSRDPAEPTAIWQADEYPTAGGGWATTVSQLLVAATYVALPSPARILDTRAAVGLSGPFVDHRPRTFQVTGRGGVPAGAVAITGNLTVTGQQAAGYVSLTPTPLTSPPTSTLNFPLKDNRANGVTTPLGLGGTLSATYVGGGAASSTQLVFDVTGYFVPALAGTTYTPLPPARILDTRSSLGLAGPFVAGVPRAFAVAGRGGVPDGAVAVTGNLTVVGQNAAGYVSLTTQSTSTPGTSTLNFPLGDIRANGVTMALGTGADLGKIWATFISGSPGTTTQLVFDVTGSYVAGPSGLRYVPLTPVRALDTRSGNGLVGPFADHVPRALAVAGRVNIPAAATAVTTNVTVVGQDAAGYVSVTVGPEADPCTSTLNFPLADIRANNAAAPLGDGTTVPACSTVAPAKGTLSATYAAGTSGSTTQLVIDVTGFFIPASF